MTALARYQQLETTGLWRDGPDDQRREVAVSLGDATLVISSMAGDPITHWSLAAVERLGRGRGGAVFVPGPDAAERLELNDPDMIEAIETLRAAIDRTRPHPGRLRLWLGIAIGGAALAVAVMWLPGAITRQTVAVLPEASRVAIGERLLDEIVALSGPTCSTPGGRVALTRLAERSFGPAAAPRIAVLPDMIPPTLALPGNVMVVDAGLAEDFERPDVLVGYLLAEDVRRHAESPMQTLLQEAGLGATFRLLTTGEIDRDVLHDHAARRLSEARPPVPDTALLDRFAAARVSSEPYAYARDVSGEATLALIEADPLRGTTAQRLLGDAEWVSLQDICSR